LFNDTLGYNISYGEPSSSSIGNNTELKKAASASAVQEVVKRTKLDELIQRLPQGFETIVGERGASIARYVNSIKFIVVTF